MEKFKRHQKVWFMTRVGKMVEKEATVQTPASVQITTKNVVIADNKHALGCYVFHLDNKVNFK